MDAAREFGAIVDSPKVNWLGRLTRTWAGRVLIGAMVSTGAGVLFALPSFSTKQWHMELRVYLAQFWGWCLVTPLIVLVDRRLPIPGRELGRRFSAHLLASLVFTEVYFYIFTVIRALLGVTPWSSLRLSQLLSPSIIGWQLWSWLIYWVIVGGLLAYRYYERYLNSELRLERLEHS